MSTEALRDAVLAHGVPEFTSLGKRLEFLRIERGISKQRLARHAGTSRQQLWRVMTGKSELTTSLRERLAGALAVDPATLIAGAPAFTQTLSLSATRASAAAPTPVAATPTIDEYLADPTRLADTLRTLPSGDAGRRLKRALLNAVEDLAMESGRALPADYSETRRRVLAGEL